MQPYEQRCYRALARISGGTTLKLKDRSRGHIWLTVQNGKVIGALGSEPGRFVGHTLDRARHIARHGGK